MSRRTILLVALAAGALGGRALGAAPDAKRVGIFAWGTRADADEARAELAKALNRLGWAEGRNLVLEVGFVERDPLPEDAREFVQRRFDVILTSGTQRTRLLHQATRVIPIVTDLLDPVASGFAQSLARPGGNVTGLAHGIVHEKKVDLIARVVPRLARIGIFMSADLAEMGMQRPAIEAAAHRGIACTIHSLRTIDDFERGFRTLRWKTGAAADIWEMPTADTYTRENISRVMRLAIANDVATLVRTWMVEQGGLIGYEARFPDQMAAKAPQIDLILRGTSPAVIPFNRPTRTELAVNRKTAAALKLTLPEDVLLQADRIVE